MFGVSREVAQLIGPLYGYHLTRIHKFLIMVGLHGNKTIEQGLKFDQDVFHNLIREHKNFLLPCNFATTLYSFELLLHVDSSNIGLVMEA